MNVIFIFEIVFREIDKSSEEKKSLLSNLIAEYQLQKETIGDASQVAVEKRLILAAYFNTATDFRLDLRLKLTIRLAGASRTRPV